MTDKLTTDDAMKQIELRLAIFSLSKDHVLQEYAMKIQNSQARGTPGIAAATPFPTFEQIEEFGNKVLNFVQPT